MDVAARCGIAAKLQDVAHGRRAELLDDWRSWNAARARAAAAASSVNPGHILSTCPRVVKPSR
jgi:hypothetical protein